MERRKHSVEWKFDFSRTPWLGVFFERLIWIMKIALSKQFELALLYYVEPEDTER